MSTTPGSPTPGSPLGGGGMIPGLGGAQGSSLPPGPAGPVAPPSAAPGAGPGPAGSSVNVATFPVYAEAQRAVDYLSDNGFPVERTAIIGTDLRLVENVLGRLTVGRAALAGTASGAWFGLFFGLIIGIFTNSNWFAVIIATVLIGAAWGAIFGALAQSATRGQRDFTSRSTLQAASYAVIADAAQADQARHLLVQMNWRATGAQ
jgi:hypothetical protein